MEYTDAKFDRYKQIQFVSVVCTLTYLLFVIFSGDLPYDTGDGLLHFAISKQSWASPEMFLNHWGKPLFILFSSGFAQFGFKAYTIFNVLVFLSTILLLFSIFKHFKIRGIIPILTPIIFLTIPDYTGGVVGGLTEPFFGLLLVIMLWACIKEKWILFAIVASFTPFARSEGMLVVVSAPLMLLLFKQWKALPFVFLGFLVYAGIGKLLIDQPMWYFENDPYPAVSSYGKGLWSDYLTRFDKHIGYIPLYLLPLMFVGFFMWKQQQPKKAILTTLYFFGIYFAIIFIHSYLWANGLKGSLGLTRIATQGLPAALGLGLVFTGFMINELHKVTNLFAFSAILCISVTHILQLELPIKETPYQKIIRESGEYVQKYEKQVGKIYYFQPLIAYHKGITVMETHPQYIHSFLHLEEDVKNKFKVGDIIIREAQFGPIEQGLPFEELNKYPWIKQVKHYYVNGDLRMITGEPESVIVYQVFPKSDTLSNNYFRSKTKAINGENKTFHSKDEYVGINETFKLNKLTGARQVLKVSYSKINGGDNLYIIFDDGKGTSVTVPMDNKSGVAELYFVSGGNTGNLFIHNPDKKEFKMKLALMEWQEYSDLGIQNFRK